MIHNVIAQVQERLCIEPLQKVDPNTQDVHARPGTAPLLAQAAIPAALAGIYEYAHTDQGASQILRGNNSTSWLQTLFGANLPQVLQGISDYAGVDKNTAGDALEKSARISINLLQEQGLETDEQLKGLLASQRSIILKHLPAQLNIGKLVGDETLDDKTNKMGGPISNLMHSIEKGFSKDD